MGGAVQLEWQWRHDGHALGTGRRLLRGASLTDQYAWRGCRAPSCDAVNARTLRQYLARDRKRVVYGKSLSLRVDLGGRRIIQKKQMKKRETPKTLKKHNSRSE